MWLQAFDVSSAMNEGTKYAAIQGAAQELTRVPGTGEEHGLLGVHGIVQVRESSTSQAGSVASSSAMNDGTEPSSLLALH